MAKLSGKNTIKEAILQARGKRKSGKVEAPRAKQRWPDHEMRTKVDRHACMRALIAMFDASPCRTPVAYDKVEDPASRLAIDIEEAIAQRVKEGQLRTLVRECIREDPAQDIPGLLGQAKAVVYTALGGVWEREPYNDSWRMWPSRSDGDPRPQVFQQRGRAASKESDMASSKKKASKKATAKKKGSVKAAAASGESTGRKGKPPGTKLLAPVKKDSQRGKVLAAGLRKTGADPDELASELKTTRSSVMSMFHDLNSRSGIGYTVAEGKVIAELPKGCDSPWAVAKAAA